MDVFRKKKFRELNRQLLLKENECVSLKSDLYILERENYELKIRLGENSNMPAFVKSSKSSFIENAKVVRSSFANSDSCKPKTQVVRQTVELKDEFIENGAISGAFSASSFVDNSSSSDD
jgi:hypothetical protein